MPRSPPLAGFSHQAESLCVPNWVVPRPNTPKISASLRHCSRFLENRAGDLVRLHCVTGMLREIPSILATVLSVRISLAPPGPLAHPFSDPSYSSLKAPDLACRAVDLWTPKRRLRMRLRSLSHIFSRPLYSCAELRFREPLQILSLSNILIRSIWNLTRLTKSVGHKSLIGCSSPSRPTTHFDVRRDLRSATTRAELAGLFARALFLQWSLRASGDVSAPLSLSTKLRFSEKETLFRRDAVRISFSEKLKTLRRT